MALFLGIRICELGRITWEQVIHDFQYVDLQYHHVKGGARPRKVKVFENVRAWLRLGGDLPPKNLAKRLAKIRKIAGLKKWPRNALRHSAASYMYAFKEDVGFTTKQLGQSESVFHSNYHHPVTKEEAEQFFNIWPKCQP